MTEREMSIQEMVSVIRYLLPIRDVVELISHNPNEFNSISEDITYDVFLKATGGISALEKEQFDLITRFIESLTVPGAAEHCLLLMDIVGDAENSVKAWNRFRGYSSLFLS
jgi:hypothetical protein